MKDFIINKEILNEYFITIKPFLKYDINEFNEVILEKVLSVYGCDLINEYKALINESDCIKTTGDAIVASRNKSNDNDKRMVCEIKSRILNSENIDALEIFDMNTFIVELYDKAFCGDISCLKCFGMLNLLGIGVVKDVETAIRIYRLLGNSGDLFAIKMLVKLYEDLDSEKSIFWKNVYEVLEYVRYRFIFVLDKKISDKYSKEVCDKAQVILCYKNRYNVRDEDNLEVAMLDYMEDCSDVKEVLNSLCNISTNGYGLSLRHNYFKNNKYSF